MALGGYSQGAAQRPKSTVRTKTSMGAASNPRARTYRATPRPKPKPRTTPRASQGASRGISSTPRSSPGRVSGTGASKGSTGSAPKPKPAPKPPTIKDYLAGDVTYQDLIRGQQRTLSDFLGDIGRQTTEAKTSFADVSRSMETERERALEAMMNEFASRGLLKSGLFGERQGEYQQDWQTQMTGLEQGQKSLLSDLTSQKTNFKREQELASEAAKQDAIRRRASKYGV